MHLFSNYVEPLMVWLHANPNWALFFTFLISFSESLAIIGSIIPGSLTMTAIGILAGSGVLRIDLTLIIAALGALMGDGASYAIGFFFSDKLSSIWPFNRYPNILGYGNKFFEKHGGKSVLIGRFVGPLRSIIPVIAGMMHMTPLHFFIANFFSAIGWSLLYVLPGYLIGTAGNQLSADSARLLFGFIIVLLVVIWIASLGIRYLIHTINQWYSRHLGVISRWFKSHRYLNRLFRDLNQESADTHYLIISLLVMWGACFAVALIMTIIVIFDISILQLNSPISFFLQSLRTPLFDKFFIMLDFIVSPLSLGCLFLLICGIAIYAKDWRILRYIISLGAVTLVTTGLMSSLIHIENPSDLFKISVDASFPDLDSTWATALFVFLICYLLNFYRNELSATLCTTLITILILTGFSSVYLGDNWATSVVCAYFIGISIALIHWIFYQRQKTSHQNLGLIMTLAISSLVITSVVEYFLKYDQVLANHAPKHHHYVISEDDWWHQDEPLLPLYTKNRIGKNAGLFNIQYAGSINYLEKQLKKNGWVKQSGTLFSLIIRIGGQHNADQLPLMQQLYLNKKPVLMMTYKTNKNNYYLIRLWRSNYRIVHYREPIWLGSVILVRTKKNQRIFNEKAAGTNIFSPIFPAIRNYRITNIHPQDGHIKSLRYVIPPELLIVKEPL